MTTPAANGQSALALYKKSKTKRPLMTLCEDLDAALGGGIPTGSLTEFYGVPGVGKTQIGIQLACDVQIPAALMGLEGVLKAASGHTLFCLDDVFVYAQVKLCTLIPKVVLCLSGRLTSHKR
jgi:RecA/RadA recombinase